MNPTGLHALLAGLGSGTCPSTTTSAATAPLAPASLPFLAHVPMFRLCSLSMNPPLQPSARLTSRAASWPPWLNCAGTFPGSWTTRMPAYACARSPAGSRCLPCPQRSRRHAKPNHRRGDGRSIQVDAAHTHVLSAWIVEHDPPEHPGGTSLALP